MHLRGTEVLCIGRSVFWTWTYPTEDTLDLLGDAVDIDDLELFTVAVNQDNMSHT